MSQYDEMDRLIIRAIRAGNGPLYDRMCNGEADRIANASGRQSFRVLDGRLQALRRAGKIKCMKKSRGDSASGWNVVEREKK